MTGKKSSVHRKLSLTFVTHSQNKKTSPFQSKNNKKVKSPAIF